MGKQKTQEEFVEKLANIHPNIIVTGKYVNSKTNISVQCNIDNYRWDALPLNLTREKYNCPKCSGRANMTKEEYHSEMTAKHQNIEILGEYKKRTIPVRLKCKIDGHEWEAIPQNSLKNNSGCPVCAGNMSHTQESYEKLMKEKHPNITVIGKYVRLHEPVELKCSCGYQWKGTPSANICSREAGCPSCCQSPRVVWEGNCITAKEPWMLEYFVNKGDGLKYLPASSKRVDMICPCCKTIKKNHSINNLYYTKSIGCKKCSDGKTYNEKFVYELLSQLKINFDTEKTFDWCTFGKTRKRYDFYLPLLNMIIETHGIQHYEETYGVFKKTLKEEQENDKIKKQLAKENGIKHYIVLDCRNSNLEHIKNSILKSELSKIFDLSNIDWLECEKATMTSLIYKVCEFKNINKNSSLKEIGEHFNLCTVTIGKYLKKGNDIGMCVYDKNEQKSISIKKTALKNGKNICVFDENKNYIKTYDNITQLIENSKSELGINLYGRDIRKSIKSNIAYNGFYCYYKETLQEHGLCKNIVLL